MRLGHARPGQARSKQRQAQASWAQCVSEFKPLRFSGRKGPQLQSLRLGILSVDFRACAGSISRELRLPIYSPIAYTCWSKAWLQMVGFAQIVGRYAVQFSLLQTRLMRMCVHKGRRFDVHQG